MIVVGIDQRPSARDALVLGRWLSTARGEDLVPAWVHSGAQLPSLLGIRPLEGELRDAIEAMAEDVRRNLSDTPSARMRLVSSRSAAQGLAELAERERASLIILGASDQARFSRILPGSTARRLLSGSPIPVAIAPRGYAQEPERAPVIGVGFDGGPEAKHALDWAAALASSLGGRLRIVAVHRPVPFGGADAEAPPVEAVGHAMRRHLRDDVDAARATLPAGFSAKSVFRDGDPAVELAAESRDVDLLVLGSRGYGPVRAVLLGSVSEATIAASEAPVVVVPRGAATRDHYLPPDPVAAELPTAATALG